MTLLAMGEALKVVGYNYPPLIGGTLRVQVLDPFAAVTGSSRFTVATFAILAIAIIVFFYLEFTVRSPLGRALKAFRDDEIAASLLGKDIVGLRLSCSISQEDWTTLDRCRRHMCCVVLGSIHISNSGTVNRKL